MQSFAPEVWTNRDARLVLKPGKLVLVLGPSGSGKSSALAQVERHFAGGCMVGRVGFPEDVAIVDRIAPAASLAEALSILSACALGEPRLWLRRFSELSEGEQFRARLARAIGLHGLSEAACPLICDEFCAGLHRRAAKAISFNLRKIVTRRRLMAVVACSNDDIVRDLQPDLIVRPHTNGSCTVYEPELRRRNHPSFLRRLQIRPGGKRDYDEFAAMHYRSTDELGFVSKVFVLCDRAGGEALGIVVYAHPPMELSLRREATGGRFVRNPKQLNRRVRILRRLAIHPDVRGCGLGHYLVRKTLPLAGTEYVECLASMGSFNPVFEKAGMERIGRVELSPQRRQIIERLQSLGVDPNGRDFIMQVCRRRDVRELICAVVYEWYSATTGEGKHRVARQSPESLAQMFRGLIFSQPVYYLWKKGDARRRR